MTEEPQPQKDRPGVLALIAAFASLGALALIAVAWFSELLYSTDPLTLDLIANHFPAIVGLPLAAMTSFIVVVLLKHVQGPIEFEGLGFKFRGASGPIVMWMMCFLVIAASIKLLW